MTSNLDEWRKRLRFRAWHRGTRELDLIMGKFADRHMDTLDENELAAFEALLEENDVEVFGWVAGRAEPPEQHAALVALLRDLALTVEDFS